MSFETTADDEMNNAVSGNYNRSMNSEGSHCWGRHLCSPNTRSGNLQEPLGFAVGDRFLSNLLLPAFTEQFRDMNEHQIDEMMSSFAFENCIPRPELVELIKQRYSQPK
jgi:hypothetical protein